MFEIGPYFRERGMAGDSTLDWADRFFDDLPSMLFREMIPSFRGRDGIMPAFDISETDAHFVVRADLPGINANDLDISLAGNVLTIKGEKKDGRTEDGESCYCSERRFGSFSRSFKLPSDVSSEGIEAAYKDGVLSVTIPKSEASKHRKITVKTH